MDARESVLSLGDIIKIYARKFVRIAPVYYLMWLLVWGLTARVMKGSLSNAANDQMAQCSDQWLLTLFMVNNLQTEMQAYSGCYQQGWPL